MSVKNTLIKIAYENPGLRPHLLPLIMKAGNEEASQIVRDAIDNTDPAYMGTTLRQRNPGSGSAGSTFDTPQTVESLKNAEWRPMEHNLDAVTHPDKGYEADIPGKMGIAFIEDVPDNTPAVIQPSHGGKGMYQGKLMAELVAVLPEAALKPSFTTMILSPKSDDPGKYKVATFHPGAASKPRNPILHENVKAEFKAPGDVIHTTVGKAKSMGFHIVKHVPNLPK